MKVEWDEKKNAVNSRRHGIDFADVPEMFNYYMLIDLDDREDYQEDRWVGIGVLRNSIAIVVFTEHQHDTIRIISARKANKYEQKRYQNAIPY